MKIRKVNPVAWLLVLTATSIAISQTTSSTSEDAAKQPIALDPEARTLHLEQLEQFENSAVEMVAGEHVRMGSSQKITTVQIADTNVLAVVARAPNQLELIAKHTGNTSLHIWDEAPRLHRLNVTVVADAQAPAESGRNQQADQPVRLRADRIALEGSAASLSAESVAVTAPQQKDSQTLFPKVPDSLEEMLAVAMRSSPDVLVAEAKVRQAQAELHKIRVKIVPEITGIYKMRRHYQDQIRNFESRVQKSSNDADRERSVSGIAQSKNELAEVDVRARALLGLGGQPGLSRVIDNPVETGQASTSHSTPRPEIPEKFRKILDQPAMFSFPAGTSPDTVCQFLQGQYNLPFVLDNHSSSFEIDEIEFTFTVNGNISLGDALQAMADGIGEGSKGSSGYTHRICFLFRDYGVLFTSPQRALKLRGAVIPAEIPYESP